MAQTRSYDSVDYEGFARAVKALGEEAQSQLGDDDIRHLRKIERWGRLCTIVGYGTAWLAPNPLSALLISQGAFTRWTTLMHHIGHRGYDRVPGIPPRYTSKVFASGWRRFVDFLFNIHLLRVRTDALERVEPPANPDDVPAFMQGLRARMEEHLARMRADAPA